MKVVVVHEVAYCYECPHNQPTMDGPSCMHPDWIGDSYSNLVGRKRITFPTNCPEVLKIHRTKRKPVYRYHELINAVGHKHLSETRYETALRLIREAKTPFPNASQKE